MKNKKMVPVNLPGYGLTYESAPASAQSTRLDRCMANGRAPRSCPCSPATQAKCPLKGGHHD